MRIVAGLVALAIGAFQAPPPADQTVRIDVVVADARGRPVDALKSSDFELRDDGVAQPVDTVTVVRSDPAAPRVVAMFLDEYHVSADATASVRAAMTRFVETDLRPHDLLVVMRPLDSLFTIRLTTDREAARAAIASFEGRKGDYAARNGYERNYMAGTPARIEVARTQVAISAINALAVQLGTVADRRKSLIVVSEGMGRAERRRGLEYLPTTEAIVRSAIQSNVSIYSILPVAPAAGDRDAETIRILAAETAGQTIVDDIAGGLRRAIDESTAYYLLSYRAARPNDGKFHPVDVQVKKPGLQIRARSGYFAPSPDVAVQAALLARLAEKKAPAPLEPAPHASVFIRPWFGTARGSDGKTRVTVVWEPAGRPTGDRNRKLPSRVVLTALSSNDAVLFEGAVMPTGPAAMEDPGAPPLRAVFEMPPGRLRVRMSIQDAAQQVIDTDVRSIAVRDFQSGVSIATPEVLRARNAREFRLLDAGSAVPVASREFSRTERILVRFRAYAPGDAAPSVSARLLSRMGPMRDLAVVAPDGDAPNQIDLPLAGLAVGEYIIELTATSPAGDAKDVIDFRVTT